jgi:hypothetical protein
MRYRIDTPRIAFEQIDDETIVIDFDSGTYFSTGFIGSDILRLMEQGLAVESIVPYIARRYPGPEGEVERGIRHFIDELRRESILAPAEESRPEPSSASLPEKVGAAAFETPVLHKYTDMKDLLLLDPIHEVDAEGWPIQKPDA